METTLSRPIQNAILALIVLFAFVGLISGGVATVVSAPVLALTIATFFNRKLSWLVATVASIGLFVGSATFNIVRPLQAPEDFVIKEIEQSKRGEPAPGRVTDGRYHPKHATSASIRYSGTVAAYELQPPYRPHLQATGLLVNLLVLLFISGLIAWCGKKAVRALRSPGNHIQSS